MKKIVTLSIFIAALPVLAQQSPSFKLTEHVFNAGGHPANGTTITSPSFRVSLDAIGDSVSGGSTLTGPSFRMDGGFTPAYPPPGEVTGLRFSDMETFYWNPERSVGNYNLYRDLLSSLSGLGYGSCEQQDIEGEITTDPDPPGSGEGYFYLVTAENRLNEEGSKGWDSSNIRRPNPAPCP